MNLVFGLSPLLVVALGALLLMLADAFGKPRATTAEGPSDVADPEVGRAGELSLGSAVVLTAGAILSVAVWMVGPEALEGSEAVAPYLIIDRFSVFFSFVICLGGALVVLLAGGYLPEHRMERSEFFPLLLFSTVGAIALAAAGDMLSLLIGLETMSLGVYALAGLRRTPRSIEAALKYFLLGSFAAALMLFGVALLYGATGHTDFAGIGQAVAALGSGASSTAAVPVMVALALILAGLAFKVSAVPFHMWTPDAYEGAPTPATTYMAVAVKSAAFAMLLRVLLGCFGDEALSSWGAGWPPVLALLSVFTMVVANLVAGRQSSVKRMLAYSSIAHAGYVLIGVVATMRSDQAAGSVLFYLLAYTVSTAGAFGTLILCGRRGSEAVTYEDLAGIGRRHPGAAVAFSLFLVSLAGVPPTAGFFGKLYVFQAAIDAELYALVVIGLINSVIAAYYYLRVMVYMYMREPAPGAPVATPMRSGYVVTALVVAAALVLLLGLLPGSSLEMAATASMAK
jgi:NADH-quinone oxidoreductase subunit N